MTIAVTTIPRLTDFVVPALTLAVANAAGVAATAIRSDADILAFDVTAPTTQASADVAAVGVASVAARRDHLHGEPVILSELVEDLSPVLGAALDAGGFGINNLGDASNDITGVLMALLASGFQVSIGAGAGTASTLNVHTGNSTLEVLTLTSDASSANGITIRTFRDEPTPANNDDISKWVYQGNDDTSKVTFGETILRALDVTAASKDSEFRFAVQNNNGTGSPNTIARLTSLGVWTDSSGEDSKEYEGTPDELWPGGRMGRIITDKIRALRVGRYHSSGQPPGKPITERHISPTAEDFFDTFGVGMDPRLAQVDSEGEPIVAGGLAAKDLGGVALMGVGEHDTRIEELEAEVAVLRAAVGI